MEIPRSLPASVLVLLLASSTTAAGQTPESPSDRVGAACEGRAMVAVAQTLASNLIVNRFNEWVTNEDHARVDFETWSRNLSLGWEWDENAFATNMFAHPYQGGLYLGTGRSNCLSFWESVPLAVLGSWTWEYFGETYRPSLNDFFMTSFGGVALGEILHRVGTSIRDNRATGAGRIGRELAAVVVDPSGGLNRLFRGQWTEVGSNPVERELGAYGVQFKAGARRVRETGSTGRATYSPTVLADVSFGDPFETPYGSPYDVFTVRTQVSPDGGGLNLLRAVGRLWGSELTGSGARHDHRFFISQRFDYVDNPVYQFGEQSLQAGVLSRWRVHRDTYSLRTRAAVDAVVMGAIDAPFSGVGERTYDFGPGVGFVVELSLERDGVTYLSFYNRIRYLHTVSGAPSDHSVLFSGLEASIPITEEFGIGAYLSGDRRNSRYQDGAEDERSYLETRLYLTWTRGRGGAAP